MGGIGGFAGLFALEVATYKEPVLAASTDGVGTKLAIAQALDKHDTVGIDLVAMVVDDLVVCGAEPLFLQDYIAVGKVVPGAGRRIVGGIADGCRPGRLRAARRRDRRAPRPDGGPATTTCPPPASAWSRPTQMLGPDRVRPGDVVIAMGSSGLHSNGYSLARHVLLDIARMRLDGARRGVRPHPRRGAARAHPDLRQGLPGADRGDRRAHVRAHHRRRAGRQPGAGACPKGLVAEVDRGTWSPAPVFELIAQRGRVERAEMEKTFNMGVGMVAVVAPDDVDRALAVLTGAAHRLLDAGQHQEVAATCRRRARNSRRRSPEASRGVANARLSGDGAIAGSAAPTGSGKIVRQREGGAVSAPPHFVVFRSQRRQSSVVLPGVTLPVGTLVSEDLVPMRVGRPT